MCAFSPDGSARLKGVSIVLELSKSTQSTYWRSQRCVKAFWGSASIEQVLIASLRTDRAAGSLAFAQCLLSTASADPSMLAPARPDFDDQSVGDEAGREGSRDVSGRRCVVM